MTLLISYLSSLFFLRIYFGIDAVYLTNAL